MTDIKIPLEYKLPTITQFDAKNVHFINDKVSLRLDNIKKPTSAGILHSVVQEETYEFDIDGRLDLLDPNVCFAIWAYNEVTKEELDILEYSRWGNVLNTAYHITEHVPRRAVSSGPSTACNRHIIELSCREKETVLRLSGYNYNMRMASTSVIVRPIIGFNLKIGLWIYEVGFMNSGRNRGLRRVDVKVTVS